MHRGFEAHVEWRERGVVPRSGHEPLAMRPHDGDRERGALLDLVGRPHDAHVDDARRDRFGGVAAREGDREPRQEQRASHRLEPRSSRIRKNRRMGRATASVSLSLWMLAAF